MSFSAPSLDVRLGSIFVQVHLFETLSVLSLGGDSFYAGGNVFALPLSKSLGRKGSWEIFAGVGASFDFSTVDEFIAWGPIAPIGVRVGRRGARAALYVTPGFDMVLFPGSSLNVAVADPRLMASVWF
ncbi:MAG: hypothetical protein KTR31_20750 [Myxococcales bacterium]|nr:hypothetical protein [Myxococcales bacterium]